MTSDRLRIVPDSTESGLRELIAIREIVHAFLTADRPEEVFQFALDRVSPLVGASFACVYLVDGASELMRLAAVHNWPERFTPFLGEMRVRLGFGPSGEAAAERRVIEVPDVMADPSLEDWAEVAHELGFRAIVALPLQTGDGVLGAVAFYFEEAGAISAETRSLLRMVADQMAATAQKARLIEDLRRANAALTESNAELERQYVALLEARRVKDEFLANISHELRTPLTAVMGYLALMEEGLAGPVTDEQRKTLAQVKTSSQHLLDLIGDLLELTTLKRGGLEIKAATFDVREPLHDALANDARAVGRRGAARARAGAADLHAQRPPEDLQDARRAAEQRVQVHDVGRDPAVGERGRRLRRLSRRGHGDRHPRGAAPAGVRRVPAGGRLDDAPVRRVRAGALARAPARARARRRDLRRLVAGPRARPSGSSCRWSTASPSGCRTPRSPSRSVKLRAWVEGRRIVAAPDRRLPRHPTPRRHEPVPAHAAGVPHHAHARRGARARPRSSSRSGTASTPRSSIARGRRS